jgi:hypothetical protein
MHAVKNRLARLLRVSCLVGVFYPEDKNAAVFASKQPVE